MEHINSVQGQQIAQCLWPAIHDEHKHSQHKQHHGEHRHNTRGQQKKKHPGSANTALGRQCVTY